MTLVEVMVAVVILTVSVAMLSSTITATMAHSDDKFERQLAVEAAMNMLERMRAEPFDELFARYNSFAGDDPGGAGTAPGTHFDVPGLDPWSDDADGLVGVVLVPGAGPTLIEQGVFQLHGLPRDLNGDLLVDDLDHADDYIILPVHVRVAWQGASGRRTFEMGTMLAHLEKFKQ
jgi:type II secretory pathway pseudopilin PulG